MYCSFIDFGGDWDWRNWLKVYCVFWYLIIWEFKEVVEFFIDLLFIFIVIELMEYDEFVVLIILVVGVGCDRKGIKDKVSMMIFDLEV